MVTVGYRLGQEACNMLQEFSTSFSTVNQRVVSGTPDKYVRCGSNIMVRQFNPALVPLGSWNELWLGVRWRISSSYGFFSTNSYDPFSSATTFEMGICNTTGSVFGQYGYTASLNQHSLGYFRAAQSGEADTDGWATTTSSSFYTMASGGGATYYRVSGSASLLKDEGSSAVNLFINTAFFTASYSSIFVIRYQRVGTSSINVSYLHPNVNNSSSISTNFTSSTIMASIMEASSWNNAVAILAPFGYLSTTGSNYAVSESIHGNFNGAYLSWRMLYDNLELNDIVVRVK